MRLESGRDTLIDGAYVEGETVDMAVGRDLTLRSRQNESWSESSNFNLAGSVDVATGAVGLDSFGLGGASSERRWTDSMTQILARGGLQAEVEGHTQLTAAALASKTGDLSFSTGTFGWQDLQDYDRSESWGVNISGIGLSWTPGSGPDKGLQGKSGIASFFTGDGDDSTGSAFLGEAGFNYASTTKEGITRATLGDGDVTIRDTPTQQLANLNRDLATAQEITRDESTEIGVEAVFLDLSRLGQQLENIGNVANAMTTEVPPEVELYGEGAKEAFRLGMTMGLSADEAAIHATSREMLDTIKRGNELEKAAAFYGSEESIPSKVLDFIRAGASLVYGEESKWDEPCVAVPCPTKSVNCHIPLSALEMPADNMHAEISNKLSKLDGAIGNLKERASAGNYTLTPQDLEDLINAINDYIWLLRALQPGDEDFLLDLLKKNPNTIGAFFVAQATVTAIPGVGGSLPAPGGEWSLGGVLDGTLPAPSGEGLNVFGYKATTSSLAKRAGTILTALTILLDPSPTGGIVKTQDSNHPGISYTYVGSEGSYSAEYQSETTGETFYAYSQEPLRPYDPSASNQSTLYNSILEIVVDNNIPDDKKLAILQQIAYAVFNKGQGTTVYNVGEEEDGGSTTYSLSTSGGDVASPMPEPEDGDEESSYQSEESSTGTVWDDITPTQDVYPGSTIPRSFEMRISSGERVWVHGNATEHLAEYAQSMSTHYAPNFVRLQTQQQIRSLQAAVNTAARGGIRYNQIVRTGGWELKFSPPRKPGQLPALIHALPIP